MHVTNLAPSLWVLFSMVSIVKALCYSFFEPVKELLYIPTSQPIKFKAKAWIDVFGCRLAKAAGSFITNLARGVTHTPSQYTSFQYTLSMHPTQ